MSFEKSFKRIKEEWEIQNDSVGAVEFWGRKGYDNQPDYIFGTIYIIFDEFQYNEVNIENLMKEFDENDDFIDDINDIISENIHGENAEIEDSTYCNFENKCALVTTYYSEPVEENYEIDEEYDEEYDEDC